MSFSCFTSQKLANRDDLPDFHVSRMADSWIVLFKSHVIWNLNVILALDLTLVVGWGLQTSHVDFLLITDAHTHTHTHSLTHTVWKAYTQRHTDQQTEGNRHTGRSTSTCMQTQVRFVPFKKEPFHFIQHYSIHHQTQHALSHCITVAIPWSICSLNNAQRTG